MFLTSFPNYTSTGASVPSDERKCLEGKPIICLETSFFPHYSCRVQRSCCAICKANKKQRATKVRAAI